VTHVLFETGSDELKLMEQKVYVASGRFIVEAGKPPVVEYVYSLFLSRELWYISSTVLTCPSILWDFQRRFIEVILGAL
jgi:hypothetical protein